MSAQIMAALSQLFQNPEVARGIGSMAGSIGSSGAIGASQDAPGHGGSPYYSTPKPISFTPQQILSPMQQAIKMQMGGFNNGFK